MRFHLAYTGLALLMLTAPAVYGQDSKAAPTKLESTPEKRTPASQIDFNVELQVPLQALSHLGHTIEEARKEADPVCIASAANVLAAAEALATNKKASITSAQLWDEAIRLAEMRKSSTELAVLASLASGAKAADLKERSAAAKADEAAAKDAEAAGETKRALYDGEMHVINESHEYIQLYADGVYIGAIQPHGHLEFNVHYAYHLEGRSKYHFWHADIQGHQHHYDWLLHDPHQPH